MKKILIKNVINQLNELKDLYNEEFDEDENKIITISVIVRRLESVFTKELKERRNRK